MAALLLPTQTTAGNSRLHRTASPFQTSRVFRLGSGHATRAFTFRERSGVILVNRLTVPHGVRALEAGTLVDVFTPARADFL